MMMMRGGNGNIGGNIGMMDGMLLPTNNTTTANNATIDQGLGLGPHLVGRQLIVNGKQLDIVRQLGEGGFSFVYLVRSKYNNNNSNTNGSSNGNASNNDNADSSFDNAGGGGGGGGNKRRQRQGSPSTRSMSSSVTGGGGGGGGGNGSHMVLKITAISNAAQQLMAEKEARLLRMLNHPSIVEMYDACIMTSSSSSNNSNNNNGAVSGGGDATYNHASSSGNVMGGNNNGGIKMSSSNGISVAQHLILMEYCEGGTAFDAIRRMRSSLSSSVLSSSTISSSISLSLLPSRMISNPTANNVVVGGGGGGGGGGVNGRFDLSSLVIAFGQICNAVSYLHAQRPPIVHRDLKPINFLIKGGSYKLCDFGSAIVGHVELRNADDRRRAEDVIERTTTPMFRSPEMIDLHMTRRLTESTDVWALGCSLYSLAYLRDCFEEGSSLAILSRRYRIPEDNPYGDDLVDLIDRMLAWDYKERADMGEVIMCLSALYSNRPLPKRRRRVAQKKARDDGGAGGETRTMGGGGSYRTDGQGIKSKSSSMIKKMIPEAKKLDPNSAAAKRKKANEVHKKSRSSTLPSHESSRSRPDDGITASNAAAAMPGTSSADDVGGFDDFASFDDGVFDNGSSFDDSMLNYDTIETTLDETTNAANIDDGGGSSFSYAFGDKCQISIIATSSSGGGDDNATGGDISFRE